jgi:hypothetical protein
MGQGTKTTFCAAASTAPDVMASIAIKNTNPTAVFFIISYLLLSF